jgi:hypothetical protein
MQVKHKVAAELAMLLVSTGAALGDTAAGMQAFRNKDYQAAFREWTDAGRGSPSFASGFIARNQLSYERLSCCTFAAISPISLSF